MNRAKDLSSGIFLSIGLMMNAGYAIATEVKPVLNICADAARLPQSNMQQPGYENKIAQLIAQKMGAKIHYTWVGRRPGGAMRLMRERACDVVMGVPEHYQGVSTTDSYLQSSYVFVTKRNRFNGHLNFDNPALSQARIGVEAIGRDGVNTPPVMAITAHGWGANVIGYSLGDTKGNQTVPERMLEAVRNGEVDVAVLWGPVAGYFGSKTSSDIEITPILSDSKVTDIPFVYSIAIGVRPDSQALKQAINAVLAGETTAVANILQQYHVPMINSEVVAAAEQVAVQANNTLK